MANGAKVTIHAFDQRIAAVPELLSDTVDGYRGAVIECLQSCGAVRVLERLDCS